MLPKRQAKEIKGTPEQSGTMKKQNNNCGVEVGGGPFHMKYETVLLLVADSCEKRRQNILKEMQG